MEPSRRDALAGALGALLLGAVGAIALLIQNIWVAVALFAASAIPLGWWFWQGRTRGAVESLPTDLPRAKLSDWKDNHQLPLGSWACLIEGLHPPLKGTDIGATKAYPIFKIMKTAINNEKTLMAMESGQPGFHGADRNTDVRRDELRRYFEEHHQHTRWRYPEILFPERTDAQRAEDKRLRRNPALPDERTSESLRGES